jgi:long-chain acyl-CoA synthetase
MRNAKYALYDVDKIATLQEHLNHNAQKYADRDAFVFREKSAHRQISYKQFKEEVEALGTGFYSLGIKNARIAILGENSYAWVTSFFAIVNGGNVAVPVDKDLPIEDIAHIVSESETTALVYSNTYADVAEELKKRTQVKHYINMQLPADQSGDDAISFEMIKSKGAQLIEEGDDSFARQPIKKDTLAAIIYTSGTTGKAKGVMLTHCNFATNVVCGLQNTAFHERSLLILPLHHTFSLTGGVLLMMHAGSSIFICTSLKNFAADMAFHRPNDVLLVPMFVESLYKKIWDGAKQKGKDKLLKKLIGISNFLLKLGIDLRAKLFSNVNEGFGGCLKIIITGGALIDPKYVKGFRDFGISLINGYGITECSPVVAVIRNHHYRDDSVGLPLSCCEIKIDRPNENGEGEILVKGPTVMQGYYKNTQATSDAMQDGWFRTGDIGKLDTDNFVYITGRLKNVIILGNGKNIYPEELEMLVCGLPYIKEALVYAEKTEEGKEPSITAEVFLDADALQEGIDYAKKLTEDIEALNKPLPIYKRIMQTKIRDREFERTASKKIIRKQGGQ